MTLSAQARIEGGRNAVQPKITWLVNWWNERRRLKGNRRYWDEMSDRLWRDFGVDYLFNRD